MKSRKSWREKLESSASPRVVDDPKGRGKMLIPRPLDVDVLVRQIPEGKLATVGQIRERLARGHGADLTCPLVTGIFLRIVAEVAEEDEKMGTSGFAPYWRVVKDDGGLNDKFPGGVEAQAARLQAEGHLISLGKDEKPRRIQDFAQALCKLN